MHCLYISMHLRSSIGFNSITITTVLFLKAENMTLTLICFSLDPFSCCSMNQKGKRLSRPSITVLVADFNFNLRKREKRKLQTF